MQKNQHVFSFLTDEPVSARLAELVGFCQSNKVRISEGLLLRALLTLAAPDADLIDLVRARVDHEKAQRKARRDGRGKIADETDPEPVSFQVDEPIAKKARELVEFCKGRGLPVSNGLLMRTLVMATAEQSPALLGQVEVRVDVERATRRAKRNGSISGMRGHGKTRQKAE